MYSLEVIKFIQDYKSKYGVISFDEISNIIVNSEKVSRYLIHCSINIKAPSAKEIMILVNDHKQFIFKPNYVTVMAGVIVLWRFTAEVNRELKYVNDIQLNNILNEIKETYNKGLQQKEINNTNKPVLESQWTISSHISAQEKEKPKSNLKSPTAFIIGLVLIIISLFMLNKDDTSSFGSFMGVAGGITTFFGFLYWRGIFNQ